MAGNQLSCFQLQLVNCGLQHEHGVAVDMRARRGRSGSLYARSATELVICAVNI